jgi:hypothetical protein
MVATAAAADQAPPRRLLLGLGKGISKGWGGSRWGGSRWGGYGGYGGYYGYNRYAPAYRPNNGWGGGWGGYPGYGGYNGGYYGGWGR